MEDMPWVFCGRSEKHVAHGPTCPGTGKCGNRDVHEPHLVLEGSLAPYWCFADRIRLYREGRVSVDGRKLVDTTWSEDPIPALIMDDDRDPQLGHDGAVLIGSITGIRREPDTGWVTGLLTTRQYVSGLAAEADFSIYRPSSAPGDKGDVLVMTGAKLHAVTLGNRPTWDEMTIQ